MNNKAQTHYDLHFQPTKGGTLADAFDFIASRDDVEHGKLDPEIYFLLARELEVQSEGLRSRLSR